MNLQPLTAPGGPWLHGLSCAAADVGNAARRVEESSGRRVAARVVRGGKARTKAALLDEFAAALQFPLSFGENWDALHDCLCDLAWLGSDGLALFVADAARLLEAEDEEASRFLAVLTSAAKHWQEPGKGRSPRPFHAVFHSAPAQAKAMTARWKKAGAVLNALK